MVMNDHEIDNGDDYDSATMYQVTPANLDMTIIMRMAVYGRATLKTKQKVLKNCQKDR